MVAMVFQQLGLLPEPFTQGGKLPCNHRPVEFSTEGGAVSLLPPYFLAREKRIRIDAHPADEIKNMLHRYVLHDEFLYLLHTKYRQEGSLTAGEEAETLRQPCGMLPALIRQTLVLKDRVSKRVARKTPGLMRAYEALLSMQPVERLALAFRLQLVPEFQALVGRPHRETRILLTQFQGLCDQSSWATTMQQCPSLFSHEYTQRRGRAKQPEDHLLFEAQVMFCLVVRLHEANVWELGIPNPFSTTEEHGLTPVSNPFDMTRDQLRCFFPHWFRQLLQTCSWSILVHSVLSLWSRVFPGDAFSSSRSSSSLFIGLITLQLFCLDSQFPDRRLAF